MTQTLGERLYPLLPAYYRRRDFDEGEPLRALLEVLEEPLQALERDLLQLHDDWFIETCAEWVVPYIGDLLGVQLLSTTAGEGLTLRSFVANTLAFRRRKGTPGLLERVAQDVTGWPAAVVESFQRLATTQNVNHVRLGAPATVDLRNRVALEALGGPFESAPYTVDVRSIAEGRGRYNARNVGVFLWTLRALKAERVAATPASDVPPQSPPGPKGFYRFSPLGQDIALWQPRSTSERLDVRQTPERVPEPIGRFALFRRLSDLRAGIGDPQDIHSLFQIFLNNSSTPIDPKRITVCDLTNWHRPAPFFLTSPPAPIDVAVDPVLGRLSLPTPTTPIVTVTFYYGAPAEVGGGVYQRPPSDESVAGDPNPIVFPVSGGGTLTQAQINSAIALWPGTAAPPKRIVLEIADSLSYKLETSYIIPTDVHLQIRASRSGPTRPLLAAPTTAAVNLTLSGATSQLTLEGLWLAAGFRLTAPDSSLLTIAHCTLVPGISVTPPPGSPPAPPLSPPGAPALPPPSPTQPSLQLMVDNNVAIVVRQSIMGPLLASSLTGSVRVEDSIIDKAGTSQALRAGTLTILRSTVFGTATAREMDLVEDTIFTGKLVVERIQKGCPRFCFLPDGSETPRAFRCQPQMAVAALGTAPFPNDLAATLALIQPRFLSQKFGEPDYARLSPSCPDEIATGGSGEGEMGAFQTLQIPIRLSNLRVSLTENLRFGLEVGTLPAVRLRR
jgi:hypothetical protein